MGAVVTARSGYDIRYPVRGMGGERGIGGYYAGAAQAGERPGRWFGRGAVALGLAEGQQILTDAEVAAYEAVYSQVHPVTGEQLGRAALNSVAAAERRAERLAKLLAAEPHATAERRRYLAWQAAVETRPTAPYTDVTVSFSKSISVLHVSIRENARQARLAGRDTAAAWWDERERRFGEVLHAANLAALRHLAEWAGVTRTGSHAARIGEVETGRWESAGLVVTSWLQGTSRDGDPHDHVHNLFARMVRTDRDGKWRALDTMALRYQLPAAQAIATAHVEAALTREFGVAWVQRADGAGNEICGITQETMDAYSSRAIAVDGKLRDLAREFTQEFGRAPNQRELMWLKDRAWEETRDGKPDAPIDWDAHAADCDARLGGQLAQVAHAVSPCLRGYERDPDVVPAAELSIEDRAEVVSKALARVQEQAATWSRANLLKAIGAELPPNSRGMDPDALVRLIGDLADEAIAGKHEPVLPMSAPEWPAQPYYLRRALDGRSVYTRPGADRYATRVQLSMEEQLLLAAQRHGAPCLSRADAARLLGADTAVLDATLRESVHEARKRDAQARGLRLDQAASAYHLLTSPRTVEILIGPAGSGKTRTLGALADAASAAGLRVVGLATSQAGRNALAEAGVTDAMNVAQFLGHLRGQRGGRGIRQLEPGTVILLDEASMTPTPDLRDIAVYAARHGHKLIVSGDHAQLSAVGSGGGMSLLVAEFGHVELAEAVRFAERWEQEASLRLREGDASVLTVYDERGRIRGNVPAEAMEDARRLYVAEYIQGTDVELIIHGNALAREMARRIRDDLLHLGIVQRGREVRLAGGNVATAGDLIIARTNDHPANVANGDVLRVESVNDDGTVTVRRRLGVDQATGHRLWDDARFRYAGYATADLAYGATAHTKQGKTVAVGIPLVTGAETAEWLYSAMTRGGRSNIACVFTHQREDLAERSAGTRAAPELARAEVLAAERAAHLLPERYDGAAPDERDALAVLADVVGRHDSELSAMALRLCNLANADHLAALHAIWQGETSRLSAARYRQAVRDALPAEYAADPLDSAQATWLWRTLRAAEAAGMDARDVTRRAIEGRPLTGARDLAAVIDARIRKDNPAMIPAAWRPWSEQVPTVADPEQARFLAELAAAMDARKERIGEHAAQAQPAWAIAAAGPLPTGPLDRLEWQRRVSHVGAYRELYGWDHDTVPVGPEPAGDTPDKRAAWHAAYGAMTRTEGIDLRDRPDGTLLKMRDTYRAETEWAPPHVAGELRAVRTMLTNIATSVTREDAEAAAARAAGDHELAAAHDKLAASYRAMEPIYRQVEAMDAEIMDQRGKWARVTEGSRHLAVMADAELRRRHPQANLDALRSAEPAEPSAVLPDDPAADPGMSARLSLHAQFTAEFWARLGERQGLMVPAENPDCQHEGQAWPSPWQPWARDAVLKPPKPQIRPAEPVLERAADFEAEH